MKYRSLFSSIIAVLALVVVGLLSPHQAQAKITKVKPCTDKPGFKIIQGIGTAVMAGQSNTIEFELGRYMNPNEANYLEFFLVFSFGSDRSMKNVLLNLTNSGGKYSAKATTTIDANLIKRIVGTKLKNEYQIKVYLNKKATSDHTCEVGRYSIITNQDQLASCDKIEIYQIRNINGGDTECHYNPAMNSCLADNLPITFRATGLKAVDGSPFNGKVRFVTGRSGFFKGIDDIDAIATNGVAATTRTTKTSADEYDVKIESTGFNDGCTTNFKVEDYCPSTPDYCAGTTNDDEEVQANPYKICAQIDAQANPDLKQMYDNCLACVGGDAEGREGIWTAIGCIKNDPVNIVQNLIKLGLGMGGGIALIMILSSGFIFSTSQGDPKRTGEAKDMLVAAITGLIFVIFSVTILQFIGYSVLRIPGFGG